MYRVRRLANECSCDSLPEAPNRGGLILISATSKPLSTHSLRPATYFTVEGAQYRFGLSANLNKLLADRRATIASRSIDERARQEVEQVFRSGAGVERVFFPERSTDIPDRPVLTFAILAPGAATFDAHAVTANVDAITREYGASARQYKNALIWCVPDSVAGLYEETRKVLAWESIKADRQLLDDVEESQRHPLEENLRRAQRDLEASIWRSYRRLLLLGKDNQLKTLDLGQMNSSGGSMVAQMLLQLQQRDELTSAVGPAFLVRNWPPAFVEWPTRSVRDAFFASPRFPRLQRPDILKETIAKGIAEGVLAYVGKTASDGYEPMIFRQQIAPADVDISDDVFIITAETATAYSIEQERRESVDMQLSVDSPLIANRPEGSSFQYPPAGGHNGDIADQPLTGLQPRSVTSAIPQATSGRIAWSGNMPAQKWMLFYSKVLTGLVNTGDLSLHVWVEAMPNEGLSAQRLEGIRAALRELGLAEDLEIS
jgi:hypothetical protein